MREGCKSPKKSNRVIAMALFSRRVICAYGLQEGKPDCRKNQFYNEMSYEWDLQNPGEMVLGLDDFNGHAGRRIVGFEGVHGGY